MFPAYQSHNLKKRGSVLVISLILILICSTLAVSISAISGSNVQLAVNQKKVGSALASAESGIEIQKYWLAPVTMPSSTLPSDYFSTIVDVMQYDLNANAITNLALGDDGIIDTVEVDSSSGQQFRGKLFVDSNNFSVLNVCSTGGDSDISRTIQVQFNIEPYVYPIFNYGLATKGPLNFTGNPTVIGANESWEADLYIESSSALTSVSVGGNSNFDGEIEIGNSSAIVDFTGDVAIAGDTGQTAIDNHVHIGVPEVEFPTPDTDRFRPYATGDVIDASTDLSTYGNTLINCTIAAGTNPVFPKSVSVKGLLFIESPNIVTFSQNVALEGIIVGDGDLENPGTDRIDFLGNFASGSYPTGIEYDAIRNEEGTSIVAPGFNASFQGNFSTLEGVVALSGVSFSGNVSALIKGTIINYSDSPMVVEGNAVMSFDRTGSTKIPAGFDTHRVLTYIPSSYSEIAF